MTSWDVFIDAPPLRLLDALLESEQRTVLAPCELLPGRVFLQRERLKRVWLDTVSAGNPYLLPHLLTVDTKVRG